MPYPYRHQYRRDDDKTATTKKETVFGISVSAHAMPSPCPLSSCYGSISNCLGNCSVLTAQTT
ncbi:hypothetical protein LZ30DRAFT_585031 [Colletotrichum cereale]|nr:hypothetical protein LZ30DRAFT_585031 [Colletotrichum cereale]